MSTTHVHYGPTKEDYAYMQAYMALPDGLRQVVRNADATRERCLATAGRLLRDPKTCRVGRRLAQEAETDWQRVRAKVLANDQDWLAGCKRTR